MRPDVIDIAGFEAKFRDDPDPWDYRASRFEAFKRRALMRACGLRPAGRALELACANGETTRALARRALRLTAVDGSATIVEVAKARTRYLPRVKVRLAVLPAAMPRGPFDLIVVSELLYYLKPRELDALLVRMKRALAPGGRLVLLHHLVRFEDAAMEPGIAHEKAVAAFARRGELAYVARFPRFAVAALVARRGLTGPPRRKHPVTRW